ncbi:MAG TPA: hypothetical protein VGG30_08255 [Pirellulales bacterium]
MHEQLHIPPAIILHRFCSVAALISSSQVQVSFMPPAHFSNFMVQRGTIIIEGVEGAIDGMPPWGIEPMVPIEPIIERSNIIVLDILNFSLNIWSAGVDRLSAIGSRTRATPGVPSGLPSQSREKSLVKPPPESGQQFTMPGNITRRADNASDCRQ